MASLLEIRVPDLGEIDEVDVVEILVEAGDSVEVNDGLVTLESDKASMDVPTNAAGVVKEIALENGATVKTGDLVVVLEVEEAAEESPGESTADSAATDSGQGTGSPGKRSGPCSTCTQTPVDREEGRPARPYREVSVQ